MAYPAPRRLQLRRGNTAAVSAYLGSAGELIINTDNWTIYVHDGVTVGGYPATINTASITSNISSITNGTAVFGNLIPSANVTYSLGNVTHQWNDLYVSNNTIYVGGVPLSIDNTGNLTVNGNTIPTIAYVNTAVANVTVDLSSYALTANVTAANVGLKGYVDQANTIQSQQISAANVGMKGYVDATIRANIANISIPTTYSNANVASYLAVGNVTLGNITIQDNYSQQWQFRDGALIWPDGAGTPNGPYIEGSSLMTVYPENDGEFRIQTYSTTAVGSRQWKFTSEGNLTIPDDGTIRSDLDVRVLAEAGNIALGTPGGTWMFDPNGTLTFPANPNGQIFAGIDNDFIITTANTNAATYYFTFSQLGTFSVPVDLTVANAAYTSTLVGYNGNLTVTATTHNWQFDNTGVLTLPNDSAIIPVGNTGVRLSAGIGDATGLLLNNTDDAEIYAASNVSIYTNAGNTGWRFDTNGNLIFPDNSVQSTAFSNTAVSTYLSSHTDRTFGGNLTIQGNLTVNGNVTYISVNNVVISDNIINLADLNSADSLDIGFVGHRTPSGEPLQHTGLVRDAGANQWRLFSNVVTAPGTTVDFTNAVYDDLQLGNITSPTITAINNNIAAANAAWAFANTIQSQQIAAANVGIIGYVDQGNTIQATAITAANVGLKGYVDFANTVMKAYVDGQIIAANANVSSSGGSSYGDSNVAAYLPTYSGNIANITLGASGVLTFADGTTQITAGGGSYSNIQVATYLPTYAGTVSASLVNTSGNILSTGLSVFGNTRIGLAGAVSGQFHSVVGNITQTSSGGAVYINTTGNVLAAAVVAGAVTSTGTVAVNAATGITTNQTTFLLANATATTINMGGAATTINMGTNTSNVWVGRALGNQTRELLLRAQGTWNTAINIISNGGFNSPPYANQAVIGGSGTGMTANYSSTGGYITTLTIYNPGTGYQNGDVISVPGGIAGNSFTLTNYSSTLTGNSAAAYTFGIEGNLTVPGNVTARNFIGTIATASQTNITTVGTLGTLTVSGNATVGNLVGTEANTRIIANTYVTTFDIYGNVSFPGNITVSSLGITMPTRPAFRVNGSVGPTQTTGNVNLKSPQAVVLFNQGNYYDGTTGKFTAPVAGIYSVGVSARVADNSSSQIAVLKNGLNTAGNVACFWESDTNAGTAIHFGVNGTIQMAVGDYLSANILLGNINFDQNDNWHVTYLG